VIYNNVCEVVSTENKCEGWYIASKDIQLPLRRRTDYTIDYTFAIEQLKKKLKEFNKCNRALVGLAKAHW
jgi:hypothetical protein